MEDRDVQDLKDRIKELKETMVTQAEFGTVRGLVFGMAGFTLLAVLGAVLSLVIK